MEDRLRMEEKRYIMNTYKRYMLLVEKARGRYIWDGDGKRYLDFFSGISVSNFGHLNPQIMAGIRRQLSKYLHVSNYYYSRPQIDLARRLCQISLKGRVFFSNSGAEANECAIKIARKWGGKRRGIIVFKNSFHGRTLATLAATGQAELRKGFGPLPGGFRYAGFNDFKSVLRAYSKNICAIMVEPIQGEGGVYPASRDFLKELRGFASKKNILLIFDEVQSGMGRTGKMFAYEYYRVRPDIVALGKGLGGGLPLGATVVSPKCTSVFHYGDHGSTFGGNPLSCAAGIEVLRLIDKRILNRVQRLGSYFKERLMLLEKKYPSTIKEVRGIGLMLGMELFKGGEGVVRRCLEKGLLINCMQKKVLRFLPPFVIIRDDIDRAIGIIEESIREEYGNE